MGGSKHPFRYFNSSPEIIRFVVMMYVRYPLSLRNVENLFFGHGIDICHETVRFWWNRFGLMFANQIRKRRVVQFRGYRHYLRRAVDHEGEVSECYVTRKRNKRAVLRFLRKALKCHGKVDRVVTDGLKSYPAAMRDFGNLDRRIMGQWLNNQAENSHPPFRRREHAMLRFRRTKTLQQFVSVHASFYNHFNPARHLVDRQTFKARRSAVLAEWQNLIA